MKVLTAVDIQRMVREPQHPLGKSWLVVELEREVGYLPTYLWRKYWKPPYHTCSEIADMLGCHQTTVASWLRKLEVDMRTLAREAAGHMHEPRP